LAKDLIIVRAGKRSLHHTWLDANTPRSWELLVCPYEEIGPQPAGVDGLLTSDIIDAPAKFAGLKILLGSWQEWRDYRYVTLADDDLFASQQTWSRFFDYCAQFGASLAQPALTVDPPASHWVTIQNTEFIARRVSFVEGMMPTFRADVLSALLGTLELSPTGHGFGIEFLWGKQLGYKDIFVVDNTSVVHTRPSGSNRSPDLKKRLDIELQTLMREHNLPWLVKTFSGFDTSGNEILENNPAFLYRLYRGYNAVFDKYPWRLAEIFRLQLMSIPGN
jgi:hypothetical protein